MAEYSDPRPSSQPEGSTDLAVAKDNLITLDKIAVSTELTVTNRKGVTKKTWAGQDADYESRIVAIETDADERISVAVASAGYQIIGDFADVIKAEITTGNQVYTSKSVTDLEKFVWRYTGTLPYTPTESTPVGGDWAAVAIGELQAIARSLNVLDSQVIYSTDTVTPIGDGDGVDYIYNASTQKTYAIPAGVGTGETIVSIVGTDLETNLGNYVLSNDGKRYTIDTVADIANLPNLIGARVDWLGYYSVSDGGSNWGVIKSGAHVEDGGSIFTISGDFYVEANLKGQSINVKKFGAKDDAQEDNVGTDNQPFIQSTIDYAEQKVVTYGSVDARGGADIRINGSSFIVRSPLRISKSNVSMSSYTFAALQPDFPAESVPSPAYAAVLIVGSAEDWLSSGGISDTTKYNKLKRFRISRTGGNGSPIGILFSGARSPVIDHVHTEQVWCGLWLENVSELESRSYNSTGCSYSIIGDSRKGRSTGQSPLGVANADNDVSSNVFTKTTSYYAQHTGVLLINTGTCSFRGTTMGKFSESPDSGPAIRYGLTGKAAGFHVWGGGTNYTRGMKLDETVFEPSSAEGKVCILLTSENQDNPIVGVTLDGQIVQTYIADHDGGEVTVLLQYEAYNGGWISGVKLSNSGFLPAASGYYVPTLMKQSTDAEVGSAVRNSSIIIDNCFPTASISTSDIASSRVRDVEYIEQTDMKSGLVDSVPAGWTRVGTATDNGGSSGVEASIAFSGNAFTPSYMWKKFSYNNYVSRLGSPYVSLWYRGDVPPHIDFIVNNVSTTARTIKSGDNLGRYGNALQDFPQSDKWRRAVYMFRPFSANYTFDELEVQLGRVAADGSLSVEIKNVEIGFYEIPELPYNPF